MTRKSCPIQELLLQLLAPYPCNYYHGQRATKVRKSPLLLPTPQPHYLLQPAAPNGCPIHCFPPPPAPPATAPSLLVSAEAVETWPLSHLCLLTPSWAHMFGWSWSTSGNLAAKESGKFHLPHFSLCRTGRHCGRRSELMPSTDLPFSQQPDKWSPGGNLVAWLPVHLLFPWWLYCLVWDLKESLSTACFWKLAVTESTDFLTVSQVETALCPKGGVGVLFAPHCHIQTTSPFSLKNPNSCGAQTTLSLQF